MRRLISLLALLALLLAPAVAQADGDPGSDVLVNQNLYVGGDAGLTVGQQLELERRLDAAQAAGLQIRVAIIAKQDDLGSITELWQQPADYAKYLGLELQGSYSGRLLVVMPNGFGVNWPGHGTAAIVRSLAGLRSGATAAALVGATDTALDRIAGAAGATLRGGSAPAVADAAGTSAAGSQVTSGGTGAQPGTGDRTPAVIVLVLGAVALLGIAYVRRGRPAGVALAGSAFAAGVIALVLAVAGGNTVAPSASLATNPNLDAGRTLNGRVAPDFTLTDQFGKTVSLSQFRGKVVILDFNDAECTTICPLTTTAMLDAVHALGPAAEHVQLLGVDANSKSNSLEDVQSYSSLHGMTHAWHFVTGTKAQLQRVWTDYGVDVEIKQGEIDHTPALYVIDPAGRLRHFFTITNSYAAIPQLGQLLAKQASSLLPGHPRVYAPLGYGEITGTPPTERVSLTRSGGGTEAIGPDGGARLYLFFATWDREVSGLASELEGLNHYGGEGLPPLTAVDEGSVEPGPGALPAFLRSLPGPLRYPLAIDGDGRLADGYQVEGEPWFVLVRADGTVAWYLDGYAQGWPSVALLRQDVRTALKAEPSEPSGAGATLAALKGSPAPLAALHVQGARVLGGQAALDARVRALRGYPVVVNVWASWCGPCKAEFGYLRRASVQFGKRVAFIGADNNDDPSDAAQFLAGHYVSYPSYQTTSQTITSLLKQGIFGTPTTFFISPTGGLMHVQTGPYTSEGQLDADIERYAP